MAYHLQFNLWCPFFFFIFLPADTLPKDIIMWYRMENLVWEKGELSISFGAVKAVVLLSPSVHFIVQLWHCYTIVIRVWNTAGAAALFLARNTGHWCKHWQVAERPEGGREAFPVPIHGGGGGGGGLVLTPRWKYLYLCFFKCTISDYGEAKFISTSIVVLLAWTTQQLLV